ncbi:hypothetical protein [Dyadobacter sp. MSC1_007]|uniref:hypothetical protein n=1 Tax=Dyadobacter sp. MSC1_007 TaxID=2909264 RepID=UPI0020303AEF|nr:hypothetical protein [Dyadobacter sp. MSC1_007]
MNIFFKAILRFLFVGILVVTAAFSFVLMSPFLLLQWWLLKKDEQEAAELVRDALEKRAR